MTECTTPNSTTSKKINQHLQIVPQEKARLQVYQRRNCQDSGFLSKEEVESDSNEEGRRAGVHHQLGGETSDYKMKIDLPSFSRKMDIGFLERGKSVENFFSYMNTPGGEKVKLVAMKLNSDTSIWWDYWRLIDKDMAKDPCERERISQERRQYVGENYETD